MTQTEDKRRAWTRLERERREGVIPTGMEKKKRFIPTVMERGVILKERGGGGHTDWDGKK